MRIITSFENQLVIELFNEIIQRVVFRSFEEDSSIPVVETATASTRSQILTEICGEIDVTIVSLAEMLHEGDQVMGGCWYTDSLDSGEAREWTIGLRGASTSVTLSALIHEAMHLGQYLTGRLRTVKDGSGYDDCTNYWLGEPSNGLDYDDQPWEDEVYGKQDQWLLDLTQEPDFLALLVRLADSQRESEVASEV
ncbi:MAG: hypothetical protein HOE14_11970 [Gemmatimonadales bacterium]|jgi:hypothetical protein|nr:hypothetical protein [Gemmatimonadales bacterium]